jgi:hypothetical protein
MSDIPQIRPTSEQLDGSDQEGSEQGSILIPKINPEKMMASRPKNKARGRRRKNWRKRKWMRIAGIFLSLLILLTVLIGGLVYRLYNEAVQARDVALDLVESVESQNLPLIKDNLQATKQSVVKLKNVYRSVSWARYIPLAGSFVQDGQHGLNALNYGLEAGEIVVEIIEPYADIIGFSGESKEAESGEQTAQDRLDFIVKTIPEVVPKADSLIEKVKLVKSEVDQIDPNKYPKEFRGIPIRLKLKRGIDLVDLVARTIENSKPLLVVAPDLMGTEEEKTYLVIFQNDKELRPTGGFITAYSIAKVSKGKFEPVISSDIYNLDNLYTPRIPAPDPIIDYLKGPYLISKNLRLRDMNWSPDFVESMKTFVGEIDSVGIKEIDGVIAVDTELLVNILDVLGPIGVPGYGEYSTKNMGECGCPQVIYELESFADIEGPIVWSENEPGKIVFAPPNYDNRKKIIGPLMNSILANALGQSKEKIPALFEAVFKSLTEKHVLFYMLDNDAQAGIESFGIAGTIVDFDGDYLHVNDANLGGRKSNLYVTQEVVQEVEIAKDGSATKTVEITYKNPKEHDGWLNSVLPNWVRIYVPKGSTLIDFSGVEDKKDPYEELGKTVFSGFFELRPQGVARVTVTYKLPFKVASEYKLLIQKQPGTGKPLHSVSIGKKEEEFFLKTDKELKFSL